MAYVKLDHIHEETGYRLRVGENECSVAYRPYTGHWYAYNDSGQDIAAFTGEFFGKFVFPLVMGNLMVPDPDCKPKSAA